MKTIKYLGSFLLSLVAVSAAFGQDGKPAEAQTIQDERPAANQQQDVRGNVLRQLGLSREQIQQIRRMNMARKPIMDAAQRRFREANRALDEAIYADNVNETEIQARLKELQLAQADVAMIRFTSELAIRKVLTPDQLVRFRDLRQRFEQARDNFQTRRQANQDRPVNRPVFDNVRPPKGSSQAPGVQPLRPNQRR
jgi:Spy/CpxP family protein refolding chaperone